MDTSQINLLVYDTQDNFSKSKTFLGTEGSTFKRIICVENKVQLDTQLNQFNNDELVYLVVHVFALERIQGLKTFLASGIKEAYPKFKVMYISDGASDIDIQKQMVEARIPSDSIYRYHDVYSNLREGKFPVYTKQAILEKDDNTSSSDKSHTESGKNSKFPQIKYAVITALYEDEFEELKKVFDFPEDKIIATKKKKYYRGYLKSNKNIEIVAGVQNATGMVDASIIATQMLELFKPEYLIMSGVCGGSKDFRFGDIVIAKQIFTFQKGKISDVKNPGISGVNHKLDLYNDKGELVDYNQLFDCDGKQISVSIEKFEIEHDTMISLDSLVEDSLNSKKNIIKDKINEAIRDRAFFDNKTIKIELAPVACSTMVINKKGYFEDTIKVVNRKTAAVEMESYGVARACQFANDGKTTPLIFKSVMDNTVNKADSIDGVSFKKFAAYTSAQFLKCLLEEEVI